MRQLALPLDTLAPPLLWRRTPQPINHCATRQHCSTAVVPLLHQLDLQAADVIRNLLVVTRRFLEAQAGFVGAANKYNIADLKDACEDSLLEDINSVNLERLQEAWLYQLNKLKKGCLTYLFDFGKIYDVRDEISDFFRQAD